MVPPTQLDHPQCSPGPLTDRTENLVDAVVYRTIDVDRSLNTEFHIMDDYGKVLKFTLKT